MSRLCCTLYKSRGGLIDRRTHYSTYLCIQAAHTGPCIRTHVVSNRYRGYRQTGGEINTHRPTASATTNIHEHAPARNTYIHILVYRIYFGASTSRPRICGDSISIALRGFRDASTYTGCLAAIGLFSADGFPIGIRSFLRRELGGARSLICS